MKLCKAALVCLVCICLIAVPVSAAINLPEPTEDFFVNDFADVMSPTAELAVFAAGVQLYERTGAQVVVVTVETLDGAAIEDVSLRLARKWGIGDAEKDNGVLLLFAEQEREVRIEVGYGLEGAITDATSGRILDTYVAPALATNDFGTGLQHAHRALVETALDEYGLTFEENYEPLGLPLPTPRRPSTFEMIVQAVIGLIVLGVVIYLIATGRGHYLLYFLYFFGGRGGGYRGGGGGYSGGYRGGGGSFGGGGASRKY